MSLLYSQILFINCHIICVDGTFRLVLLNYVISTVLNCILMKIFAIIIKDLIIPDIVKPHLIQERNPLLIRAVLPRTSFIVQYNKMFH